MQKTALIIIGFAMLTISVFAGELDDINAEINKIGSEMITLGSGTRELNESLESAFMSGKHDTSAMKLLRGKILARRMSLIKDISAVTTEFKAIPEVAAKYAAVEKSSTSDESRKLLKEIDDDYKSGKFDTESIKALKEKIEASEKFISENKAELRKMFDALPQFSESIAKAKSAQDRLTELATKRDSLLKKREALK